MSALQDMCLTGVLVWIRFLPGSPSLVVQTQAFFSHNFCSQDDAYIILQLVLGK